MSRHPSDTQWTASKRCLCTAQAEGALSSPEGNARNTSTLCPDSGVPRRWNSPALHSAIALPILWCVPFFSFQNTLERWRRQLASFSKCLFFRENFIFLSASVRLFLSSINWQMDKGTRVMKWLSYLLCKVGKFLGCVYVAHSQKENYWKRKYKIYSYHLFFCFIFCSIFFIFLFCSPYFYAIYFTFFFTGMSNIFFY